MAASLGEAFAEAFAAGNEDGVRRLLHDEVDFRGLTPNKTWQASGPGDVISEVIRPWLEDSGEIEELVEVSTHAFADTESVSYRFRGRDEDGEYVCEQHAYLTERDGSIDWMRVVCSGGCTPTEADLGQTPATR
jgi:hypothetical protein